MQNGRKTGRVRSSRVACRKTVVSHTVVRGEPNAAQLYYDKVLNGVLEQDRARRQSTRKRDEVHLAETIYYCMKENPSFIHVINTETGKKITNEQLLKRAVSFARALIAAGASGTTIVIMLNNHEDLLSLYYGALFSDTKFLMLDTYSTKFELNHFISIASPFMIICEDFRFKELSSLKGQQEGQMSVLSVELVTRLAARQKDSLDDFALPTLGSMDEVLCWIPTSGSTGRSKCAPVTDKGLTAHLPTLWSCHSQFPRPTKSVLLLSTAQWMTWTSLVTSCPVYQVTMLLSPDRNLEKALDNADKYQATWTLIGAACIGEVRARLAGNKLNEPNGCEANKSSTLSSLETLAFGGAHSSPAVLNDIKGYLPSCHVCDGYGMTEAQGGISVPARTTPAHSNGKILNVMDYKLVDEGGNRVGPHQSGELYLRSDCIIKGYLNNLAAYQENMVGEWFKTGDLFKEDDDGNMYFLKRKKFWFKYNNTQISPEELEDIINCVPGVHEAVVVERSGVGGEGGCGAGAGVVLGEGEGSAGLREEILKAVAERVVPNKYLRGGVVFVESLPRTANGKLNRTRAKEIINQLLDQEKVPGRQEQRSG